MSLMSFVEFAELALDLIIYAIIRCRMSSKAKRQLAAQNGIGAGPSGMDGARMPWEPAPNGNEFSYRNRGAPPPYRAAARMSRAYPNEVRDVLLNL